MKNTSLKILTAILALLLSFSFLVSCDNGDTTPPDSEQTPGDSSSGGNNDGPTEGGPEDKPEDIPNQPGGDPDQNLPTVDPNSPEGKAQAELNTVIAYLDNHFKTNDTWYPMEGDQTYGVINLPSGKYQCTLNGEPTKFLNLSQLFEAFKSNFELDGTFTYEGDDVIYTLADGSASARWPDIDAFDLDAYMQSDEYKQIILNATIASLKQEVNHFNKVILTEIISGGRMQINSELYLYENESKALCVNQGNLADALNLWITIANGGNSSGTFSMDGDAVVYTSKELPEASTVWSWER